MPYLPKPYDVESDATHLEHVRPIAQAIGIALQKAASSEGLKGNPSAIKRLSLKTKAPDLSLPNAGVPRLKKLKLKMTF